MNKHKILSAFLSLLMMLQLLTAAAPVGAAQEAPSKEALIAAMSTEDKIAQMLMPAFRYYDGAGVTELNEKQAQIIAKYGFAGVILYAQNNVSTEQTLTLIDALQKANIQEEDRPQLLISVDQEGAGVTRLSHGTQGPGNMALGATGDSQNAYALGEIIGRELHAIGYNVDFAPVVDVNCNPDNPVIGVRSFSDDANTAAAFGSAFMKGLHSEQVVAALKHFPGHGDTATDSHTGLPRIDKTYAELKENELVPFRVCIENGAQIIMTAHIQYPNIETETYTSISDGSEIELPATLSRTFITDILRTDLGYDGVVITDAMNMAAINAHFNKLDSARLAINAGVDILLMPVDPSSSSGVDALEQYVKDVAALADAGTISMENVDRAVGRILTLKEKNGLLSVYEASDLAARIETANSIVGSKANHDREWEIAKRSVTLVKNNGVLPLASNKKTVILVPYANEVKSGEYTIERLRTEGLITMDMDISVFLTRNKSLDEMKEAVSDAANVIAVAEQYSEAGLAGAAYSMLDAVADYVHEKGGSIVFVSCYLPYDAARLQKGDAILLAYSANGMNEKPDFSKGPVPTYGVSIPAGLYTVFDPDAKLGTLPVNIPKLDDAYRYSTEYLYERGSGLQYPTHTPKFVDVLPGSYYEVPVRWALKNSIVAGTSATTFSPNAVCTRAQVVTILWRAAGSPEPAGTGTPFDDVPRGAYYYKAVLWATEAGITGGTGASTFSPDATCTRAQIVTFLWHCEGDPQPASTEIPFKDVKAGAYYEKAVLWASENGITAGTSATTFSPAATCTRAQIVTFLHRDKTK